jgi:hypothetical protein
MTLRRTALLGPASCLALAIGLPAALSLNESWDLWQAPGWAESSIDNLLEQTGP